MTALAQTTGAGGETLRPLIYSRNFNVHQSADALANIEHAATLGLPELQPEQPHLGTCIIVGAAPSVRDYVDQIKAKNAAPGAGNTLFVINSAHNWALDVGLEPDGCVLFEVDADPSEMFKRLDQNITYYVGTMCHPSTFEMLKDHDVVTWHLWSDRQEHQTAYATLFKHPLMIHGGVTTLLRTIGIAWCRGFRDFELYGVDSSHPADGNSHVYHNQTEAVALDEKIGVLIKLTTGEERQFTTRTYLAQQIHEFKDYCRYNHDKFTMRVHGDGALPWLHRAMFPQQYGDIPCLPSAA